MWLLPAVMSIAVRPAPNEAVAVGVFLSPPPPWPSRPYDPSPQQRTEPSDWMAQVWSSPAAIRSGLTSKPPIGVMV